MFQRIVLFHLIFLSVARGQKDFQSVCQTGIRQDQTNYIHCARKQLDEIPRFSSISQTFYDELVLNDNQIEDIPSNAFVGLRVKRLNLSGNRLRSIAVDAFRELANYLEELIIEFDPTVIRKIPDAIVKNLINLRTLKLIHLDLSTIDRNTFQQFRQLEHLALIKSNIERIHRGTFRFLPQLRSLNLEQNRLNDSIWSNLTADLAQLETFILSQNQFHSVREEHFRSLKSLKLLDLSSNGLQTIDAKSFPSTLEKLFLQNNELNSLQLTFLFQLKGLNEFNFDFNRLTFLPEKIFQSNERLKSLSMQGNDLNTLNNHSFDGLKHLLTLNLARNRLQFARDDQPFQSLISLKYLNLDRNAQMNLSSSTLFGLASTLQELSIQNCQLTSIDHLLDGFTQLQRLKLSSNSLTSLSIDHSSQSLISIDLQRNRFSSIPNLFRNFSTLIDLDLSSNQISRLSPNDLINYPRLKNLGLTANPLICDCRLRWLRRWLVEKYDRDLIRFLQWTCSQPEDFRGKQFTSIDEDQMNCPTMTNRSSTKASITSDFFLKDVLFTEHGQLFISWDSSVLRLPKFYQIEIYDQTNRQLLFQRSVSSRERSIEIDLRKHLHSFPSTYLICLHLRQDRSCRNVLLRSAPEARLASMISSTDQYLYFLGGGLLGALLISFALILFCLSRHSSLIVSKKRSDRRYAYQSLKFLPCPSRTSDQTSECSLHSSASTKADPYHIYQQISAIHHCPLHRLRTAEPIYL